MKYQDFLEVLESIAPAKLAEDWDNSGVQIDPGKEDIEKVLVCLDVTPKVVEEAISEGVDLIVAHHPLFFTGAKMLCQSVPGQRKVLDLIREDIGVVSCHTNFDVADGGNNDFLAELIGIRTENNKDECGRPMPIVFGALEEPMSLKQLFLHTQDMLGLMKGQIRAGGDPGLIIEKVAICTGAGSDFLDMAGEAGCQALITGDVKHHEALEAYESDMAIIDAGHYGTEKWFIDNMSEQLRERCPELDVIPSSINTDPFLV